MPSPSPSSGLAPARSARPVPALDPPAPHSWLDDLQAFVTGTLLVGLALLLLKQGGLVTGGLAGAALLVHHAAAAGGLAVPFGAAFVALNLPFYGFAWLRMGPAFTLRTLVGTLGLALVAEALPRGLSVSSVHPGLAAIAGGLLAGVGLLILFRHRASLGGVNIVALWLQQRLGWRAGRVQAVVDVAILAAAAPWLDGAQLAWSVLGAGVLNAVISANHRPGRYRAA